MQRYIRSQDIPLSLNSRENLDHSISVPLVLLTENLPSIPIIPISYSGLDAKNHFEFGRALRDVLSSTNKRIAIIASGDLSHALSSDAPAGFKKEGQQYDDIVRDFGQHCAVSAATLHKYAASFFCLVIYDQIAFNTAPAIFEVDSASIICRIVRFDSIVINQRISATAVNPSSVY